MTNATVAHAPRKDIELSYAVLAAGTLIAIAIVVTALVAPARPGIVPNPQGGVWIERGNTLYLCHARAKAPAACVNAADGTNLAYGDIPH